MPDPDTQPTLFATTQWTVVHEAARGGDAEAVAALGDLCGAYWAPLYRYVRRMGVGEADAEDLVQGFFARLLEKDGLRLVDRERGRFRAFLLGALKHYRANEWRRAHREKRGGFSPHLSIDWRSAETGLGIDPADRASPDLLYDRDWAVALLDRVLDEMARTERDFDRWKPFLGIRGEQLSYGEIAERFGLSEGAARVAVHRLRKRYRLRLRAEIARTLVDDGQVEEEMRALFAALSA
jgi:RNA polymerase sigma factor (sigma-70 family)